MTGGSGFIGRHVVGHLLAQGAEVRILDVDDSDPPSGADLIKGSVVDEAAVGRAMDGVEQIFHLAAKTGLWGRDPGLFDAVNHRGTCTILRAAETAGVSRLVYTSSSVVLVGRSGSQRDYEVTETTRLPLSDMLGAYGRSKWRAERAVQAAVRDGLPAVIVSPTIPIGPGDRNQTPPTRMLIDLLNGTTPAWLDCILNLVDVRDVAEAHLRAAELGRTGERYLLAGENIPFGSLVQMLEDLSGIALPRRKVPPLAALMFAFFDEAVARILPRHRPRAPVDGVRLALRRARFGAGKARQELGFMPRSAKSSLADSIEWLASENLIFGPAPASRKSERAGETV